MKRAFLGCVTAIAISLCAVGWLVAPILVVGIWEDCIPGSIEYPCPTPYEGWAETIKVGLVMFASTGITVALVRYHRKSE